MLNISVTPRRALTTSLMCALLGFSSLGLAHDLLIFPNSNTARAVPSKMAFDITSSNDAFRFDRAVAADSIRVLGVDGRPVRDIGTVIRGYTRTSFELPLTEEGTYRISYGDPTPAYITTFNQGEDGPMRRIRGDKTEAAELIPAEATNVRTVKTSRYALTFLTARTPSQAALEPTGTGFEIKPLTHPADYVNDEEIRFQLLLDNQAVTGRLTVKPENHAYVHASDNLIIESDAEGVIRLNLAEGGRFLGIFSHQGESSDPRADSESHSIFYSFEVFYE